MGFGSIFNRKKKRRSTNSTSSSPDGPSNESLFIQSPMRSSLENFTHTQLREIEEVFKKFDVNGHDKISASELGSILNQRIRGKQWQNRQERAMEEKLSSVAKTFTPSPIQELSHLAQRCNAINLAEGFPDFPALPCIKQAVVSAINNDFNQYKFRSFFFSLIIF
ncbi:hypothetical protein GQ457_04G031720 [Hibiscus cannabinus]